MDNIASMGYSLKDIIELLRAGAHGCGWAASEAWGDAVGRAESDMACLTELADALESAKGTHLWLEGPDELCQRITR